MKQVILMVVAGLCLCAFQLTSKPNTKLTSALSIEELSTLTPEKVDYYNFLSMNGFHIHEESKNAEAPLLSSIVKTQFLGTLNFNEITQDNFNPFVLNIIAPNTHMFFQIDGTGKTLQLFSNGHTEKTYRNQLTNQRNAKK